MKERERETLLHNMHTDPLQDLEPGVQYFSTLIILLVVIEVIFYIQLCHILGMILLQSIKYNIDVVFHIN